MIALCHIKPQPADADWLAISGVERHLFVIGPRSLVTGIGYG